ncbi:MAG: UDP-N-acetylmuramoyl-tripeptide--D-alanyl-D-alanine ligase [Elusimicrobiales bacterium]|nr:UDP-N-acetylmuramoyl-tripeptide--D-alanyl-D-alanine ligase [Elusimicrobiales bacterium]
MKLNIKPEKLALVCGGKLIHNNKKTIINEIITDTRILKKGDIFWALKGKNFDGNDFVDEAIKKGAKGIISSIESPLYKKTSFYIVCSDTLKALHEFAKYHYSRFNIKTISVTGSNGKTTTKEMIKNILSSHLPTISNKGNLNNEFGLPLSVLETQKKHRYGVFEIGSSLVGEVDKLSKIINPDIAVITTIAAEHMEFFKNMENVFRAETEVIKNLKKNGKIIVNGDNKYLQRLTNLKNVISFGFSKKNSLFIEKGNSDFIFNYKNKKYHIRLKNDIEHNYLNAAAAFIACDLLSIPTNKIIKSLESFEGVEMRMQIIKREKSIIIFDAYNANPQSMELAIKEISKRKPFSLILGDMKELGNYSKTEHLKLGKKIEKIKPDFVFLIGPEIKNAYDYLKEKIKNIKYYSKTDDAVDEIKDFIEKNNNINILIKASRSMKFEKFIDLKY